MSPPVTPGAFDIGRVLQRLFGVLGRNFMTFLVCAAVLTGLPMLLVGALQAGAVGQTGAGSVALLPILLFITLPVALITGALLQAAIIHGTVSDLNGRKASLTDCLTTSLRLLLPVVAISILTGIAYFVGLIFLIVPGIIVALAFCVAVPAEVVERLGIIESIGRSVELTRNHRGAIFALFVLYVVVLFIVQLIGAALAGVLGTASPLGFVRANYLIATPLIQTVNALIAAAGIGSVYYELRSIKEGIGPEALAAVFD
ncbi:MAG TPA: hypothetical protein VFE03_10215 [Caulobacteraceae bacterium]|jgi:hypothetical protein|nr:hypothetical protein [Caulobacteraceae bacterium]